MQNLVEEWQAAARDRRKVAHRMWALKRLFLALDTPAVEAMRLPPDLRWEAEEVCRLDGWDAAGQAWWAGQRELPAAKELVERYRRRYLADGGDHVLLTAEDWRVDAFRRGYRARYAELAADN